MNQTYFMEKAVELSLENMRAGKWGPFWAIIVKDGKIVGTWANHVTSENDPTAHAEVVEPFTEQGQRRSTTQILEKMRQTSVSMMIFSTKNLKRNLRKEHSLFTSSVEKMQLKSLKNGQKNLIKSNINL